MLRLPIFQSTSSRFFYDTVFTGQKLRVEFDWNTRSESWFVTIIDPNGDALRGIKVVPNWPLLRTKKGFTSYRGDLIILPTGILSDTPITYDNLGTVWVPYLVTQEEAAAWEEENGSR